MKTCKIHVFEGTNAAELVPIFADVETYPSFVPGYKSARVVSRDGCKYKTESVFALQLGIVTFQEELDSVTIVTYPQCIEVLSTGRRFIRSFGNTWRFRDLPGACEVTFEMTIEFAVVPVMVRPMIAKLADAQAEVILQAFITRIGALRHAA
jgi:ribosome-associated toxin RatA of RatAB toxin-antitoxin module